MAAPAQINTLRASDFPSGLSTKDDVDRLFQYLNPFLQQAQTVTSKGTSMAQNIDGQFAKFTFTGAATFVPLLVRLKDGKKPAFVLARALNTQTNQTVSTQTPAYTYLGQNPKVGNQLRVDDLPGLTTGDPYEVSLFVFF